MKSISTALAAGALAAAGALSTGIAGADPDPAPAPAPATQPIGTQGAVPEGPGVHGWTISDLRPSSDAIPYQPRGTLWEATATDEALQGAVFPIVANLSARSASGQNYQALFTVPTAQGQRQGLLRRHRRRPEQHGVPNWRQRPDPLGGTGTAGPAAAPSPRRWVARAGDRRQQPGPCCTGSSPRGAARAPRTGSAAVGKLGDPAARGQFRDSAALIQLPDSLRA